MAHLRWCTWIGYIYLLRLVGDTQGLSAVEASTAYARPGDTATLSWNLPKPGLETFMVFITEDEFRFDRHLKSVIFRVTNYNTVTVMNGKPISKMEFVGNITQSGTGVFSFMLHNVTFEDGGHYRCYRPPFDIRVDTVPGCGQTLVVFDFQEPYIVALDTALMDRSVTLSCFSLYWVNPSVNLNVSNKWRRNGLILDDSSKYNITHHGRTWRDWSFFYQYKWSRYHRSTLTVSDVSTAEGDNFQCQTVEGPRAVSGWSGMYTMVTQSGFYGNYTVVREGHSAFFIWKMPVVDKEFNVKAPGNRSLFKVILSRVYILDPYRTRVSITTVTTSADSIILQFWLHNATSEDAGKYHCSTWHDDPIPNCQHMLDVQDFQQPYIAAPDTAHVDRNVKLSCVSVFELHGRVGVRLMVSMNWRSNGLLVNDRIEYNLTQETYVSNRQRRYHRSTLTVSDVSTAKGDNFQCQAVVGSTVVSGWSEVYALLKQSGSYERYTVVREGHSSFIIWKIPLDNEDFLVWAPRYGRLFEIYYPGIYIFRAYRRRVSISNLTTTADSVILQFWLHNATSDDAGRYHCSTWYDDPIPNCQHMLYVQGNTALTSISIVISTNNIVLTCETTSTIEPLDHDLRMVYTWQRNGQEVEIGGRFHTSGQSLAVTDVKKDDFGNYSCQAAEGGLPSSWSDAVDLQTIAKLEVGELTVNGTTYTTVKENQVVLFRCMVEGPPFPSVSLIQENSLAAVNMSRTQQNVYEHAMVVRKCSQLGVYSCRATNFAGTSEDEQHTVVLKGVPREQASHVFLTNGKTPSIVINITLCSYPAPSQPKLGFTQTGSLRNITDIKNFHLATKNMSHSVFEYSLIVNDITDADFGAYIFSIEYNDRRTNFMVLASKPETSLPVVVGSSVAIVIVTLGIIAAVIHSRLNQLRDYWNLRFRSYITPMQNMPEHIDDGEYAEIDDADLPGRGAGNIVQPVVNVPDGNNIAPPCSARQRRERQQMEADDDEYEEVRPLNATNREEHTSEQERRAALLGPRSDSEPRIVAAGWSAEGSESGNRAAATINQFAETSFVTQEPGETDTDKLPASSAMYSGTGGMTAIKAEAEKPIVEGREDYVESEALDLICNRYESLMPHQPQDIYTALDNDDDITHD